MLNEFALCLRERPGLAASLIRRHNDIRENKNDQLHLSSGLCNLSNVLRFTGELLESEAVACQGLLIARKISDQFKESESLYWLGVVLATRGRKVDSSKALKYSLKLATPRDAYNPYDYQAMRALWFGEYTVAQVLSNKSMEYCQKISFETGMLRSARLQGEAALGLGDLVRADERLHHALARARAVNLVEEEIPALIGLAELRRRQGDLKSARELLDDVWEPCERGPFKLFHADAYNVLVQIERDAGNHEAAVKAATEAYRLAWCDGPPFTYHWGLQKAKAHLAVLGVPEPILPPFDESKYEPMPEVEIEPSDDEEAVNEIES